MTMTPNEASGLERLYALASRINADGTASQIGSADEILEIAAALFPPAPVEGEASTLIDQIPQAEWDVWDASNENPTVIDSDGVDPAPALPVTEGLREALEPFRSFAEHAVENVDGTWMWRTSGGERVCDWFGPSDFGRTLEAAALAHQPESPAEATEADIMAYAGAEIRRRNRVGSDEEKGCMGSAMEHAAAMLVVNALRATGFSVTRHEPESPKAREGEAINAELLRSLKEVMDVLRKEAPGTPLNNHKYVQIGIAAYAAIGKAERASSTQEATPASPKVSEALSDKSLAYTVANIRQGQSSTPRCEPPGEADVDIARKWIDYIRQALEHRAALQAAPGAGKEG